MKSIELSQRKLREYLFTELTDLGYAVSEDELDDISEIAFEFVVETLMDEDEDDWEDE